MPKKINQAWLTEDGKVPVEGNFTLGDITLDTSSLATSVNQDETNTTLSTIETKIPTGLTVTDNALIVDGSAFTQTVTGTVTANTGLIQPLTEAEFLAALPIGVTGTFWQETQPVSLTTLPTLPTGSNTIGSIGNTSFGISGTLPAFAAIPTFKIDQTTPGTTNKVDIGSNGTVAISGSVSVTEGLSIPTYNHMSLSYSGSNLSQVIYKVGGVNGTTVATLNLSYDSNNNITSITKV